MDTPKVQSTFMNLQTDFGFKVIFGSEKNKTVLIRFLNAILKDHLKVTDVVFHDKEILPPDFNLSNLPPKMIRDVMLLDRESREPLTKKIHLFFCSLKEVPKKWEDCTTELEYLLYLIKNIEKMNTNSLAYTEGHFKEIFEAARTSTLSPSDTIAYSQSLDKLRETQAAFRYTADKAREEGRAEGRAEGAMSKLRQMVISLRENGFDNTTIARFLNESPELIARL